MTALPHSIGVQRIRLLVASEEMARWIHPRMDDIQRLRIAPLIEQVLDELDVPGLSIELDRVEIDLGRLPFSRFEESLAERLQAELRLALTAALRAARDNPSPEARAVPEGQRRIDLLEHLLLHGTWPFWAPPGDALTVEALLSAEMDRDGAGVSRMLRRHRGRSPVLARIAAQLADDVLGRLLRALDPEGAALILAYLIDLRALHRARPLVALSDEGLKRALWVLVIRYELSDPGSQFNRRSFVMSVILGLAAAEGVSTADLLAALRIGLRETASHRPLSSSLPAVLGEIMADLDRSAGVKAADAPAVPPEAGAGPGAGTPDETLETLEHCLAYRAMPSWAETSFEGVLRRALEDDPGHLAALIRRYGREPRTLTFVVGALREEARRRLLHALDPESAALILAYLDDLGEILRAEPRTSSPVTMGEEDLAERLWVLTLRYVVRDAGSEWNRRSFVRSLLSSMAVAESMDYAELLTLMRAGLGRTEQRRPLQHSLPAVLRELGEELDREQGRAGGAGASDGAAPGADPGDGARAEHGSERRPRRAAVIAYLAGEDHASLGAWSEGALIEALGRMIEGPDLDLSIFVAQRLGDERARARWARALPRGILVGLVARGMESWIAGEARPGGADIESPAGAALAVSWLHLLGGAVDSGSGAGAAAALTGLLVRELGAGGAADRAAALADRFARDIESPAVAAALARARAGLPAHVLAFLLGEGSAPREASSEAASIEALRSLLVDPSPDLRAFIARNLRDHRVRARWIRLLPGSLLHRLTSILAPRSHDVLIRAAELCSAAWREIEVEAEAEAEAGGEVMVNRSLLWDLSLDILARNAGSELSFGAWIRALFQGLAARSRSGAAPAEPRAEIIGERFLARADRLARDAGQGALSALLERERGALLGVLQRSMGVAAEPRPAAPRPPGRSQPTSGKKASRLGGPDAEERPARAPIYVDNAGLVLLAPFFPRLFQALDLITPGEDGVTRFRDQEMASRAVHLLQYLVDGRTGAPEPTLALAKVLCGVPIEAPVVREIEPTTAEREACERLLRSVIAHWTIISSTSIAGLRETFLQREGKLLREEDRYLLHVQRKTVDVLVDQVPWSVAVVLHPFMVCPLHVSW